MKFVLIFKSNPGNETGAPPPDGLVDEMNAYIKELTDAGAFVDGVGYDATKNGALVREENGKQTVVKGPFGSAYDLAAGTTTIDVASLEEAIAWAKKAPNIGGKGARHEIEIRPVFG